MKPRVPVNFEELLDEAQQAYHSLQSESNCPLDQTLWEYVYHELPEMENPQVSAHIQKCLRCRMKTLKMDIDRTTREHAIEKGFSEVLASLKQQEKPHETVTETLKRIKTKITEAWSPQWAGELVFANSIPPQTKIFRVEDGSITVTCQWKPAYKHKVAFLHISWEAKIKTRQEFVLRVLNPDTQEIRYECSLGTDFVGQKTLTQKMLGFDPSSERWAISLIILEPKK